MTSHEKLSGTGLYRRLVTETVDTPGAEPWGAVLGLYEFGPTLADAALLSRIAKVVQAAGAPFLAGARPDFVGCASLAATPDPDDWKKTEDDGAVIWEELRALPEAAWVALALPRLMLRRPYGAKTEPIDSFPFEEVPGLPENESYVWGNGALACALVLTGAFEQAGWDLKPETAAEIQGLPAHVFKDGLETRVTPPSEVVLTVRAVEKLLEAGLVPVLSLKGSESVRVARLQPVASPLRALAGRWRPCRGSPDRTDMSSINDDPLKELSGGEAGHQGASALASARLHPARMADRHVAAPAPPRQASVHRRADLPIRGQPISPTSPRRSISFPRSRLVDGP